VGAEMCIRERIITSYDWAELSLQGDKKDVDFVLRKPIFPSELFACLINKVNNNCKLNRSSTESFESILENMKVLLVEDNKINELIVRKLLENSGAIVTVAENGLEALNYIKANKEEFDVVLMDIQMPVMNGYEATKRIRALNSNYAKKLPIYAITANSFQVDVEKSLENGMNGHISKPIKPEILFKLLSKFKKK
jgi:CheY-like chemotaxis protein